MNNTDWKVTFILFCFLAFVHVHAHMCPCVTLLKFSCYMWPFPILSYKLELSWGYISMTGILHAWFWGGFHDEINLIVM